MKITTAFMAAAFTLAATGGAIAAAKPSVKDQFKGTWHVIVNGNEVALVVVSPNGTVKATQPNGDKDTGRWRISPNDRYCVTFSKWLNRKEQCSDVRIDEKGVVHGSGFSAHR